MGEHVPDTPAPVPPIEPDDEIKSLFLRYTFHVWIVYTVEERALGENPTQQQRDELALNTFDRLRRVWEAFKRCVDVSKPHRHGHIARGKDTDTHTGYPFSDCMSAMAHLCALLYN